MIIVLEKTGPFSRLKTALQKKGGVLSGEFENSVDMRNERIKERISYRYETASI